MNGRGATALITGASSGIGRDLAQLFAADGYAVMLVARRVEALQALADELAARYDVKATPFAANLADPAAAWHLFNEVQRTGTLIDVVVNNAGFGLQGRVADLPLDRQIDMIQVNVTALTTLTRLFLPSMVQRNAGGIFNVASTAAFQPGPLMSVYYATKAYVESFTEGLAEELQGTGLRVTCLCPGPTATEFAQAAVMADSNLFKGKTMTSAEVARAGYEGWKRGEVLVVPGMGNRLGMLAARLLPRRTMRGITKRLNSRV